MPSFFQFSACELFKVNFLQVFVGAPKFMEKVCDLQYKRFDPLCGQADANVRAPDAGPPTWVFPASERYADIYCLHSTVPHHECLSHVADLEKTLTVGMNTLQHNLADKPDSAVQSIDFAHSPIVFTLADLDLATDLKITAQALPVSISQTEQESTLSTQPEPYETDAGCVLAKGGRASRSTHQIAGLSAIRGGALRPEPGPAELVTGAHAKESTVLGAEGTCLVCLDAAADAVLLECGHSGLCAGVVARPAFIFEQQSV